MVWQGMLTGARVPTRGSQACRTRDGHFGARYRARHALRDPRRRASLHRDPKESDLPWCGEDAREAGSLKRAAGRFRFRFPVPVARETEGGKAGSGARCRAGLGSRVLRGNLVFSRLLCTIPGPRSLYSGLFQAFSRPVSCSAFPAVGSTPPHQHLRNAHNNGKTRS